MPSLGLAGIGIATKWIDLTHRVDQFIHHGTAITYSLPLPMEIYSRLGDRLLAYLHTKYVAEKYQLPVYFRSFKGAEFFAFSKQEKLNYNSSAPLYFKQVIHLSSTKEIEALKTIDRHKSVLHVLPFFPESRVETEGPNCTYLKYSIDWKNFKPRVNELLKVIMPFTELQIPSNSFSIAMHIRTGGTYDSPDTSTLLPAKLPPLSYYAGEFKALLTSSHIPRNRPLFIHIFTDDISPKKISRLLQQELVLNGTIDLLQDQRVTFNYTRDPRLVDDVANMRKFHCLIRPDSNLSATAAKVSNRLEIEVVPTHFTVNKQWTEISIDQVEEVYRGTAERRQSHYTMPVVKRLPHFFYPWFHRYFLGL